LWRDGGAQQENDGMLAMLRSDFVPLDLRDWDDVRRALEG